MNKKIYTTPNIDVVELQGDIVLNSVSNTVNDDGTIDINGGTLQEGDQGGARSGAYFDVWEDE
ncbi:hypothetical protein [uncultured Prevotella sp.]|uniref:hypothetical protein n=1 Tax=uncultured Prevotella sp. TaxID=159272 RepID=UPI0027E30D43|nr:hypothetical protein [uncultured Prevotella sp.]